MKLFHVILLLIIINFSFFSIVFLKSHYLEEDIKLSIKEGDTYELVKEKLSRGGIFFPKSLDLFASFLGKDKSLVKGQYLIKKEYSLINIYDKLLNGKIHYRKFVIPEGSKSSDIFSSTNLDEFCKKHLGREDCDLEGVFSPNTYFYRFEDDVEVVMLAAKNKQDLLLDKYWKTRSKGLLNYSKYDLLIIASLIEKETCGNERNKVSGVILNRLKKNMFLQIDSTVIYGVKNFDGNLRRVHLNTPTKYNSYLQKGLPPTPISNPSEASLKAASNPEKHEYLYFVSKGYCIHEFSKNYEDHLKAVNKYQLKK